MKATYVPPTRNLSTAKYIIVGSHPGRAEVMKGTPFVGFVGEELDNCLHSAGIARSDCYLTYVIKDVDRPIGHYIEDTKKGPLVKPEGQEYINQLGEELKNAPAKIIIALGNIAMLALTDRGTGISKWRGSVLKSTLLCDRLVIPSVHPETILRPKNQYKNKRLLIWDLKRAKGIVDNGWHPKSRNIIIRPTMSAILNFLSVCKTYGELGNTIFYDIEVDVFNGEMTCISFAYDACNVMSIPFVSETGDYMTIAQEMEVLKLIAELLQNPDISIGGQNLSFDCHYMLHKYGIHTNGIEDTMIAQKVLLQDYPVGLHMICSLHTDLPYYKDDGKYWLKGVGSWESGWRYNALDSIVCAEALPKQMKMLEAQRNYYTYQRKAKSVLPYVFMMENGIRINIGSMKQASDEMAHEIDDTLAELHRLCKFQLNPNSPKQVAEYFYGSKGLPKYTKKGSVTTDEKALKRIARKGYKEASCILKLRGLTKERSTFLDVKKVDGDGRMRCSYNPVGTIYARASSSENIFGTGNNLQNQPHRVLRHFIVDPNHVFYGLDLSQAENRIVAYEGRITPMIKCFEDGDDVHALTTRIIMAIIMGEEKSMQLSVKDLANIGDGKKTWRDWGKKANHGLNYDQGAKAFALQNEISERDGAIIVNTYHRGYPEVRNGYHAYVRRCINTDRTLVNLMGRRTVFLDRLDDNLYKAAYACIPQGTVGDLIDQRGLSYVYYNPHPLFRYVRLCIQVHDQIGFQIPTPYHPTTPVTWEQHAIILNMVKKSLETPLYTHYKHKFVIPVDVMMGVTLDKSQGYNIENSTITADELFKGYNEVTSRWLPSIEVMSPVSTTEQSGSGGTQMNTKSVLNLHTLTG